MAGSCTVFKYVPLGANAAVAAAESAAQGPEAEDEHRPCERLTKQEPTLTLPVEWIPKKNYQMLFKIGWLKKSEVCVGQYAKYC